MNKKQKCLKIAKSLPEYFTKEAIKNIEKDLDNYNLLIEEEVKGFLIYKTNNKKIKILWTAVKKEFQRKRIGTKLLNNLKNIAKEANLDEIQVETLSPNEKYEPYRLTRNFYEKRGFKIKKIIPPKKQGWDEMALYVFSLPQQPQNT